MSDTAVYRLFRSSRYIQSVPTSNDLKFIIKYNVIFNMIITSMSQLRNPSVFSTNDN